MIISIVLSTSGVVISKHLCNGEVKNIAFYHMAQPCEHSASYTIKCPIHEDMVITVNNDNHNCCTDTTEIIKDDLLQIDVKPFEIPDFQLVILYVINYIGIDEFVSINSKLNLHFLHLPPLISQEITILVQSFLL